MPGQLADLVVLDTESPQLIGRDRETILDSWIFAGPGHPVRDVFVAGRHVICNGRHADEKKILGRFCSVMKRLAGA